jgi:hypothetical protein
MVYGVGFVDFTPTSRTEPSPWPRIEAGPDAGEQ